MIPHPWPAVVLALAAYRLVRLIGWDDLPPIARTRAWLTGEEWNASTNVGWSLNVPDAAVTYRRPVLAHFLHCAFCQGFWVSAGVYAAWLVWPHAMMYGCYPLATSGAVGLIAKNLDP